jgi:hypothetical protein
MSEDLRTVQQLELIELSHWEKQELMTHHRTFSDLSPWLNAQGVSLHHKIINEIEERGV